MQRTLRIHVEALLEIEEAAAQLGQGFSQVIFEKLDELCEMPFAWQRWRDQVEIRRRVLKQWPYSIIYIVEPVSIFTVALAHQRRRPGYWLSRL